MWEECLDDFRRVAEDLRIADEEGLVIDPHSQLIRPWNKGDSKTKGKNKTIIAALQAALQHEYPQFPISQIEKIFEEELPQNMIEQLRGSPDLICSSFEALKKIIRQADDVMAEIQLLRATCSVTPHTGEMDSRAIMRESLCRSIEQFFSSIGISGDEIAVDISQGLIGKSYEEKVEAARRSAQQAATEKSEFDQLMASLIHRKKALS